MIRHFLTSDYSFPRGWRTFSRQIVECIPEIAIVSGWNSVRLEWLVVHEIGNVADGAF